jgi:hypothetical protein
VLCDEVSMVLSVLHKASTLCACHHSRCGCNHFVHARPNSPRPAHSCLRCRWAAKPSQPANPRLATALLRGAPLLARLLHFVPHSEPQRRRGRGEERNPPCCTHDAACVRASQCWQCPCMEAATTDCNGVEVATLLHVVGGGVEIVVL